MVRLRKVITNKDFDLNWNDIYKESTRRVYDSLMKERNVFINKVCKENLSVIDTVIFKFLVKMDWVKIIGWFFNKKVSIIEKPNAFCVRVYQREFDNEELTIENYISSKIKLN